MAKKHYTDRERMEIVKKFRASGLPINRYARENGIAYATLRDWAYAFRDLEGKFVRIDFERCVKPFVAGVRLFSIVRTAMINGLDPYRCLEYALENVGRKPIEAILPYSKDLEIR